MPSQKRARQRAMREVRQAAVERRQRRRRTGRRVFIALVVVGVVVALVALFSAKSTPNEKTVAATTPIAPACPPAAGAPKRHVSFTSAPKLCIDKTATYVAAVKTDVGTFDITMDAAKSLAAVNNFVVLSRYHFYDNETFFRVIPNTILQGGSTSNTDTVSASSPPGYRFTGNTPRSSCSPDCYPIGSVAMADSGGSPSSDASQFFVVAGAGGETYPPKYTLFGTVTSGMSVVKHIAADGNPVDGKPPKKTHRIVSVAITEAHA